MNTTELADYFKGWTEKCFGAEEDAERRSIEPGGSIELVKCERGMLCGSGCWDGWE